MSELVTQVGTGRRLAQSLLVMSTAATAAAVSLSGAVLTDSDDVGTAAVQSGNVDLQTSSSSLDFDLDNAAPGDSGTVQQLTLTNSGSVELRYSMTSTTNEDTLAGDLDLDIWLESSETTADGTCVEADVHAGTFLYRGIYGSLATTDVLGDPAQGADSGDRVLASAAAEVLCFDLTLASDATAQGGTSTSVFTFDSEQTNNNP